MLELHMMPIAQPPIASPPTSIRNPPTLTTICSGSLTTPSHLKCGIVRMLMHHAETLIKDKSRVKTEKENVRVALMNCGYLEWALIEGEQIGKRQ